MYLRSEVIPGSDSRQVSRKELRAREPDSLGTIIPEPSIQEGIESITLLGASDTEGYLVSIQEGIERYSCFPPPDFVGVASIQEGIESNRLGLNGNNLLLLKYPGRN